jgi:hypothetical protein
VWLDHKTQTQRLQALGQGLPIRSLQDQTKVRHGHQVVADTARVAGFERFAQMQRDLVREKVEIDPSVGGATFLATEHIAVKATGFVKVGDMEGEMKQAAHASKHSSLSVDVQQTQV